MVDLVALEAAGVQDVAGRRALIEYLDSLGFTTEQMIEAEQRGRLFSLAGDAVISSGPAKHSLRDVATLLDRPLDEVVHAWAVLGLTVSDTDDKALSDADLEGLRTWSDLDVICGSDVTLGVLRVLGANMARFAEAESAAIRSAVPDVQMEYTFDELKTAEAFRSVATFVPRIGALLDAVHRQHLESARIHFEDVLQDTSATAVVGIGFIDLSGFTALTRQLNPSELSYLLNNFTATVADVVHADGGRVVKFIGDAVMWVSRTPALLATAAADLVEHHRARDAGLQVRAGLAFGPTLAVDGDYYGDTVNLAARLVSAARPGQILASGSVVDGLDGWRSSPTEPLILKGIDEPVVAHLLIRN
jgi:class 3 adenylate cyclase